MDQPAIHRGDSLISLLLKGSGQGVCGVSVHAIFKSDEYLSAPVCPVPPQVPLEGNLTHLPLVASWPEETSCQVEGYRLVMSCHTFLRVHVLNATYGRRMGDNKVLCNGEKDIIALDQSPCLQTDLTEQTWQNCRGKSSCEEIVP